MTDAPMGVPDPDEIWLAWDGDDRAVLGYCAKPGAAGAVSAEAIVLCHSPNQTVAAGARSGSIADLFVMEPDKDFRRPLRLPRDTMSVEILLRGQGEAVPLKTFVLARSAAEQQGTSRIGTVFLSLPSPKAQFFWSGSKGYNFRDKQNVGWAGQFACWTTDDAHKPGAVVAVSRLTLIEPHSEATLQFGEVPYQYLSPASEGRMDDLFAPAIRAACDKARRISSVPIYLHGASRGQLRGLYLIHAFGHRMNALAWSRMLAIDEAVFTRLASLLKDQYEQELAQQEGWSEWASHAAEELENSLHGDHTWFSVAEINHTLDIEEVDSGIVLNIYNASAGDHLIFYDALRRPLSVDSKRHPNGIAAFLVGDSKLEPLEDVYTESHPFVVQVFAEKPVYDTASADELPLRFEMAGWMRESGLDPTLLHLAPLQADAVRVSDADRALVSRQFGRFAFDGAAWLLAAACDQTSLMKAPQTGEPTGADVVSRALSMLDAPKALKTQPTLEARMQAAFALLRHARTPALATCMARLDDVDPTSAELGTLAELVRESDKLMERPHFADWLRAEEKDLCDSFRDASGKAMRIASGELQDKVARLRARAASFDAYETAFRKLTEGHDPAHNAPTTESMPELESLLAALANGSAEDARVAGTYRAFLTQHGSNTYSGARVASIISARYPTLEPAGNEELAQVLRDLESGANTKLDRNTIRAIASSVDFHKNDVVRALDALVHRTRAKISSMAPATKHDKELKEALPDLAAALAMHRMRVAIRQVALAAGKDGIPLPHRAFRMLMLWPRESDSTWRQFIEFEKQRGGTVLSTLAAELAKGDDDAVLHRQLAVAGSRPIVKK